MSFIKQVHVKHCVCAGIAIGGDTFPGSTLSDHCIRYQNIPQIKMIVVLGELGGTDEYSLVNALKQGGCVLNPYQHARQLEPSACVPAVLLCCMTKVPARAASVCSLRARIGYSSICTLDSSFDVSV
jgi:hypothetical protein